jgi:hypothetical protein
MLQFPGHKLQDILVLLGEVPAQGHLDEVDTGEGGTEFIDLRPVIGIADEPSNLRQAHIQHPEIVLARYQP